MQRLSAPVRRRRSYRSRSRHPISSYFTATPNGLLSVVSVGRSDRFPVAGVIEYCDTVAEPQFDTKSQLSSARIAIAFGCEPVATVAGFNAVKLPEIGLIFRPDT